MTDAEAVSEIKEALARRLDGEALRVGMVALIHALQAIEDRAALAADYDSKIGVRVSTMDAARRHMRGEE